MTITCIRQLYYQHLTVNYYFLVRMPSAVNYSHPEQYGMRGTRNFYIKTSDNMTLGVWYVFILHRLNL